MRLISVVIVTFNSERFVKTCLDSIISQEGSDFEAIVVDNGSRDNTIGLIKGNYSQVVLIENRDNLGAAKARNQGIEVAKGEWVLTLDCDTVLENSFLASFQEIKESLSPEIGIIQPKVLQYDKKTIYSTGVYLTRLRKFYDIGKGKTDNGQFNEEKFVFAACSAAAFYRRNMLDEIKEKGGFFDESFFFLAEDVDLGWRAKKQGYKTLYYPKAVCFHCGNSSGLEKKYRQYLCLRNRNLLISKNDNLTGFERLSILMLYDLPRLLYLLFTNDLTFRALKEMDIFYLGKEV
jgi:GT2 family glycosyltransferase